MVTRVLRAALCVTSITREQQEADEVEETEKQEEEEDKDSLSHGGFRLLPKLMSLGGVADVEISTCTEKKPLQELLEKYPAKDTAMVRWSRLGGGRLEDDDAGPKLIKMITDNNNK